MRKMIQTVTPSRVPKMVLNRSILALDLALVATGKTIAFNSQNVA